MLPTTHGSLRGVVWLVTGAIVFLAARGAFGQPSPPQPARGAETSQSTSTSFPATTNAAGPTLAGHVLWSVHLADQTTAALDAGIQHWEIVNAIAASPANSQVIYAAGAITGTDGALLGRRARSTNGGQSWTPINHQHARPEPTQIVPDPVNSDVAYFVTQEPGDGCLTKTADGGATVVPLPLPRGSCPSRLLIDGATGALYANGARSTDGGSSWTLLLGGYTDFLAIDTQQPPRIYARSPTIAGGFVRGTGEETTWQQITETDRFVALDPSNPQTLYAASASGLLKKSIDDGASWSVVLTSPQVHAYAFGSGSVHPSSSNDIAVFGVTANGWDLWYSSDGGDNWAALDIDAAAFAWDPADSTRLLVGVQYRAAAVSSLTANVPFPARFNTPITWTATATPLTGVEYSFWRFDEPSGWTEVQAYGPSAAYTWTPAYADIGYHALQVWARHVGSADPYESWAGVEFSIVTGSLPTVSALTPSRALPTPAGSPITWTATASGVPPLQYQFWRHDVDGWHMVQDYGSSNSYTWLPGVADIGPHALQVWVRNGGSPAAYESYLAVTFAVRAPDPITIASLTADGPLPSPAGRPIVWTATATGGIGPLQYRFWRRDADGWHMVQDYGPLNTYTWTPGAGDMGEHALQVWIRSVGSVATYDAWTGVVFSIASPAPITVTSLVANVSVPAPGVPVTWTATATGGLAPLQYKFWRLDASGWTMVQDYSPANTYTWTPGVPDAGAHALQVWVRSAGSTASYENWRGVTFTVSGPPAITIGSFTANVPLPGTVGTPITWSAAATGGVAPLEYQFWQLDGGMWRIAQAYSTTATYTWTPQPGDVGTHAIQVWVRSAGSTASYEAWASTGLFSIQP